METKASKLKVYRRCLKDINMLSLPRGRFEGSFDFNVVLFKNLYGG